MRPKDRSGFTILELLIACTITIVIVVLLGAAFGSLAKISSRTNNSIDAFRDARAAIHMMERDLLRDCHAARPGASPASSMRTKQASREQRYARSRLSLVRKISRLRPVARRPRPATCAQSDITARGIPTPRSTH